MTRATYREVLLVLLQEMRSQDRYAFSDRFLMGLERFVHRNGYITKRQFHAIHNIRTGVQRQKEKLDEMDEAESDYPDKF